VWGIHDSVGDPPMAFAGGLWRSPALPADGQASGCGYYRIIQPLDELARHDWTARYQAGRPPPDSGTYRIIVAQRTDKYAALPDWRRLRARHRLVYEIDDNVFDVDPLNWQAHGVYSRLETQEAVTHAAQVADMVTVTTPVLAEVMRARTGHRNVQVLPNCVPGALLTMQRRRNRRRMIVGWAGGASHAGDVSMIAAPVREFLTRHKRAELHLAGTDYRKTFGVPARFTDWVPVDASLAYYRGIDFDVALCPLTGTVFDAAKSSIKALEAAALGIPAIASDCPAYRDFVIDGETGFLCKTPEQFGERLAELAADPGLREAMGARAREVAAEHTIEGNWRRWADAYSSLL
jgi:glycosyltransferase involved in cell wall biosynthesis